MIEQIKLFVFVLSFVYTLKFIFEFIIKLFQSEPVPMAVTKVNEVFLYLSISYIITYFII
jgi:hypothetical protein